MKYFLLPHLQQLYAGDHREELLLNTTADDDDEEEDGQGEEGEGEGEGEGKKRKVKRTAALSGVAISHSLSSYLYKIKDEIAEYRKEWDEFKKITNPYEFIHTPVFRDKPGSAVSVFRPLSRSFFKMIELLSFFKCGGMFDSSEALRSLHLAEGPGGFIQAAVFLRNGRRPDDVHVGMTLVAEAGEAGAEEGAGGEGGERGNVPRWRKSEEFLRSHRNVQIEFGRDGTGDLLSLANFDGCYAKYGGGMQLITGDGGFDFTADFNNQEANACPLLFAQACYALVCQRRKGAFILKVFDVFRQATVDIVAMLASMYEHVFVTKPNTSRYVNSEKYVVCTGFLPEADEVARVIYPALRAQLEEVLRLLRQKRTVRGFLSCALPQTFLAKIVEANAIIGQQQIERIFFTLVLIKNKGKKKNDDKVNCLIRKNCQKCVDWCVTHNMPHNYSSANALFPPSSSSIFSSPSAPPPSFAALRLP